MIKFYKYKSLTINIASATEKAGRWRNITLDSILFGLWIWFQRQKRNFSFLDNVNFVYLTLNYFNTNIIFDFAVDIKGKLFYFIKLSIKLFNRNLIFNKNNFIIES